MAWLFPFSDIEKNSSIVLYGAGSVGYEFYCQLTHSNYCKEVTWVDSQYEWYSKIGLSVKSPDVITDLKYDYIVVAVDRVETYLSIKEFLSNKSIPMNKIIWNDNYFYDNKLTVEGFESDLHLCDAYITSPMSLIDENRLDIIVRYLYAQAILVGDCIEQYKELYFKLTNAINKGVEPLNNGIYACFSQYDNKSTINEFDESFKSLIKSINDNGFMKEYYIPLGNDNKPVNGAHRIAAALAIGVDVYAVKFAEINASKMCYAYNEDWLRNNDFCDEEIEDIVNAYSILKLGC